jgi:hypothetical protein
MANAAHNPLAGIRQYRRRSALYRWLRAHHESIAEILTKDEPSWLSVAERLAEAGVRNTKDAPPSADSVRRIWRAVCRDIARAQNEHSTRNVPLRPMPSNLSTTRRPVVSVASSPFTDQQNPVSHSRPVNAAEETEADRMRRGEAEVARIMKKLENRDY